jgi:hypothetical protein
MANKETTTTITIRAPRRLINNIRVEAMDKQQSLNTAIVTRLRQSVEGSVTVQTNDIIIDKIDALIASMGKESSGQRSFNDVVLLACYALTRGLPKNANQPEKVIELVEETIERRHLGGKTILEALKQQ